MLWTLLTPYSYLRPSKNTLPSSSFVAVVVSKCTNISRSDLCCDGEILMALLSGPSGWYGDHSRMTPAASSPAVQLMILFAASLMRVYKRQHNPILRSDD